jgi:BASS family bile acid:Na+ symporter
VNAIMPIVGSYLLPFSLWTIMFTMGLSLVPSDFRQIVTNSRAFALGVGSMLLVVPAIGVAIAWGAAPTPALTVGFILLATCPGGLLSNLLTNLARGNLALSVSMSLFVSVVYIFTLPFISWITVRSVLGANAPIAIPFWSSFSHIVMITLVPVAMGMAIRRFWPVPSLRYGGRLKSAATTLLTVIFGLVVIDQFETLRASFGIVLGMVVVMNVANLLIALLVSRAGRLDRPERIAIVMEHLIRQEATAIYVAVTLLGRNDMSLPMIVNTFVGMALSVSFLFVLRRTTKLVEATTKLEKPPF